MTVYVDDMYAPFGRMKMCHMMADTHDELVVMADQIGVSRRWIQNAGNPVHEHFDVSKGARAKAVAAGAYEITYIPGLGELLDRRRTPGHLARYFAEGRR